jgi:hypothetical protein
MTAGSQRSGSHQNGGKQQWRADALQKSGRKKHKIGVADHQMQERFHLERSPLGCLKLRKAAVPSAF